MSEPVTIAIERDQLAAFVRAARECAEDLQADIDARYPEAQRREQPSSERRWMRDSAVAVTLLDHVIRLETII